jgi:cell division FtsZ-interacting protein ZapD
MSVKKTMLKQGMKLMSDPRVMKLMQDERFMKAMMALMSVPGRVSTFAQDQSGRFAKAMDLATEQEVKDLRRTVRSLEEQLAELKRQPGKGPG